MFRARPGVPGQTAHLHQYRWIGSGFDAERSDFSLTNVPRETRLFQRFFQTEAAGGGLLLASAMVALVLANTRWADAYHAWWSQPLALNLAGRSFSLTLQ